jgi:peptide/nickel transport system permease protein
MSIVGVGERAAGSWSSPRFLRRLLRRPVAMVACGYLAVIVGVAVVAPIALPGVSGEFAGDIAAANRGPSLHHLLGTDQLGRDVLERLLVGTQVTMLGVAEALIVALVLGIPLGLIAGYVGGWTDRAVSWLADLSFSIPFILIAVVVLSVFPGSMLAAMVTLGVLAAPGLMRVVRSVTLPVREDLFVEAAEISGLSRRYILSRHILPRIAGPVIVQASLLAALALVAQTGFAFLHLLQAPPAASWGGMVADGATELLSNSWLIWPPGILIALTVLAFCLLGDAVRDTAAETWQPGAFSRRASRASSRRPAPSVPEASGSRLLSIDDLSVGFSSRAGTTRVVDRVSFGVAPGETVGIVGESGCGKTVTASAILGLLPGNGRIEEGSVFFCGRDLAVLPERELRRVRGKEIALVSQEPMISLDPAFKVGSQLEEALRHHLGLSRAAARVRATELLGTVQLPASVARLYPHELSGGMAQRVSIARALAGEPKLLIADEPTTALDVTVQAEILALLRELKATRDTAILLITHDWGVVADVCDRVVVMYAGQVVEQADLPVVFGEPLHPYTKALLASDPHHATLPGGLLPTIPGAVPAPGLWPAGCRFNPRCALAVAACREEAIALAAASPGRLTRCIRHEELAA